MAALQETMTMTRVGDTSEPSNADTGSDSVGTDVVWILGEIDGAEDGVDEKDG
jgi:hypothetical protein